MELSNLKELRNDMKSKGENFDIFEFQYKGYFVIVEVIEKDKKLQYALAKLIFLRIEDVTDKFETWAHSNGFFKMMKGKLESFLALN